MITLWGASYRFKLKHLEAWFWVAAIMVLAFIDPVAEGHGSLCLFKHMGFPFCPGCGLGHSIAWLFRAELLNSFKAHPLGIPAVVILLTRSFVLLKSDFSFHSKHSLNH